MNFSHEQILQARAYVRRIKHKAKKAYATKWERRRSVFA